MSRLDSAIDRLAAQRDCLARAADLVTGVPGPVLELGLGNGRTYDHLRALFPKRRILVFDREVRAHPSCVPPAEDLLLGDFDDTLVQAREVLEQPAALIHADIGCGVAQADEQSARLLSEHLPPLAAEGAVILCDQPLKTPSLDVLELPVSVNSGRYHLYAPSPAEVKRRTRRATC